MGKKTSFKSTFRVEYFAGDCAKIIEVLCDQLVFKDKLQKAEINEILLSEFKYRGLFKLKGTYRKRPTPTKAFMASYTSAGDYTRSIVRVEDCMGDRIEALILVFHQMSKYDKVTATTFLATVRSYLDEHIFENDV